jgi:hypothetical protein
MIRTLLPYRSIDALLKMFENGNRMYSTQSPFLVVTIAIILITWEEDRMRDEEEENEEYEPVGD